MGTDSVNTIAEKGEEPIPEKNQRVHVAFIHQDKVKEKKK